MKLRGQVFALGLTAMVPAAASLCWHEELASAGFEAAGGYHVTVAKVRSWAGAVLWVDARPAAEFERGHLPGALWISEESWEEQLPALLLAWAPERKVVVYGRATDADESARVAQRLRRDLGGEAVYVLRGGIEVWQPDRR